MKRNNKNATRALMGIDELTGHSIATPMGELVFYIIQPTNIGVLPAASITARVNGLAGRSASGRHPSLAGNRPRILSCAAPARTEGVGYPAVSFPDRANDQEQRLHDATRRRSGTQADAVRIFRAEHDRGRLRGLRRPAMGGGETQWQSTQRKQGKKEHTRQGRKSEKTSLT